MPHLTHRSGDLVYARVAAASRDLEPQLSCVDALGRATVMGPLKVCLKRPDVCIKMCNMLLKCLCLQTPTNALAHTHTHLITHTITHRYTVI